MLLQPFTAACIDQFLQAAAAEGWISDRRELDFLLSSSPGGCLVAVVHEVPVAFITSMRYAASAWIGNLLVAPGYRQQGLGRALMEAVLQRLDSSGCETVWLTASSDGAGLYRTLGFEQIDTIERWQASGSLPAALPRPLDLEQAAMVDRMGWGDNRTALFAELHGCDGWLLVKDGFLRCLPAGAGLQLGPWGALSAQGAGELLAQAMEKVSGDGRLFLDVPGGNRTAGRLLREHGFCVTGSTLLMYRGRVPAYRPELVYALASMGSYG